MRHIVILIAVFAATCAGAQVKEIAGHVVATPPTIDGKIDDQEWSGVPSVQGMVDRETDAAAPEQAQFWVAYDANFIYFGARLQDPNPGQIRATEYRTNVSLTGDDSVSIGIDLSGSASDLSVFQLNPKGATSIQLAGGRAAKREWTGEFHAKGQVTESGWEAEARIPWQIMRLPGTGKRNLRINFGRFVSRSQRGYQFVNIQSNNIGNCPVWTAVQIPAQQSTRSLKLLPYSYFGYDPDTGHIFNSGLDLKTQVTDQIELVGTINPDFRNIENQVLSLDFSRFERLAGETRPFFQEGSSYLGSALFASQRIDTFDVGANLYGKLSNKTSFGLLGIADWDRQNYMGSEMTRGTRNNLVGTITHNPDPSLTIRVSGTSIDRPDLKNDAYMLRVSKEFGDVTASVRQMDSRDTVMGSGKFQDAYLEYNRNGLYSYAGYRRVEPNFNPRLGFFPDRNFKGWEYGAQYSKNLDRGFLNDYGIYVGNIDFERINGSSYRRELTINPYTTIRNGPAIIALAQVSNFEGSEDSLYGLDLVYPRGNPYRNVAIGYNWGNLAGEDYRSIAVAGSYRLFGKLQMSGRYQKVTYGAIDDQFIFSANYDLGKDRSVSGRMVKVNDDTNYYLALRQSGNLGTEYFLILGDPNARTFRGSLILKVTVPFEIPLRKSKSPTEKQVVSNLTESPILTK